METNKYLKPAWTHNGAVRTDLPLMVVAKANIKKLTETVRHARDSSFVLVKSI